MKRLFILLLVFFSTYLLPNRTICEDIFIKMSFDDFWLDKTTLIGTNVQLVGFGSYAGDMLFVTKEFGAANLVYVEVKDLPREKRRHLLKECAPYCNISVFGTIKKDMQGNIIINASRVDAKKY